MAISRSQKHLAAIIGGVCVGGLLLLTAAALVWALDDWQDSAYPGSSELTRDGIFKLIPIIYYRQEKVFLSEDYIPIIQHWYANRFGMLPLAHGQSNCISMYAKSIRVLVEKVMQVTICDTLNGRMISVERRVQFR